MGLNGIGQTIWSSKYAAYPGESYEEGCQRIVDLTTGYFTGKEQKELYRALIELKFSPGGRVWFSAGKPKPQFANCALFGLGDSKEGWSLGLYKATLALTTGMGLGFSMDEVRPKGSLIKGSGGYASGTLSYVSMINEVARHIIQGSQRRSACLASIHWLHKDVDEWVTAKEWNEDQKAMKAKDYNNPAPFDIHNLSIRYDKEFIEAYKNSNHKHHNRAVSLFDKHMLVQFSSGDPNIMYTPDNQKYTNAC